MVVPSLPCVFATLLLLLLLLLQSTLLPQLLIVQCCVLQLQPPLGIELSSSTTVESAITKYGKVLKVSNHRMSSLLQAHAGAEP